ncbi:MAG: YceI family protein [Saprospiraceae bacterium]
MKRQINFLLLLCTVVLLGTGCKSTTKMPAATNGTSQKAKVDRNVSTVKKTSPTPGVISFAAANERYSASGVFKAWKFTQIEMNADKVESLSATLEIDLSSISEKSQKLTKHLKAWDYFDVEKYTTATIDITNVRPKGAKYVADFTLKMKDETQTMESEFVVLGKNPLRVKGTAMVDRGKFKVGVGNKDVPNMIAVNYETAVVD